MVEIRQFGDGSDLQLIHGYGDGGFRVAGERHAGSLFLLPRQFQIWTFSRKTGEVGEIGSSKSSNISSSCWDRVKR